MTIQQEAYQLISGLSDRNAQIVVDFIRYLSANNHAEDGEYVLPNRETMEAIAEVTEMKMYPEKYKSYSSFQELLDDVMGENNNA